MEAAAVAVLEESEAAELVESEEVASAVAALEAVQVEVKRLKFKNPRKFRRFNLFLRIRRRFRRRIRRRSWRR